MKRLVLSALLGSALMLSAVGATDIANNKTFVRVRDEQSYSALDWVTDHHYTRTKARKGSKSFGAHCSATTFYSSTGTDNRLGNIFGNNGEAIVVTKESADGFDDSNKVVDYIDGDNTLYGSMIDHAPYMSLSNGQSTSMALNSAVPNYLIKTTEAAHTMSGNLALKPQRTVLGSKFNWFQSLDSLVSGMSFSVSVPVVQVKTSMGAKSEASVASLYPSWYVTQVESGAQDTSAVPQQPIHPNGDSNKNIADFFTGTLTKQLATTYSVEQKALANGIVTFDGQEKSVVGIADVKVTLAKDFDFKMARRPMRARIGASMIVPTGTESNGKYAFEALAGNGGHFAAGAFASLDARLFSVKNVMVSASLNADWRYTFSHDEVRTLGLKAVDTDLLLASGQYRLMMENGVSGVFPAANVTTKAVTVTPGNQFDGIAGLSAQWKGFTFDIGYNLFYRDAEKLALPQDTWSNDTYALAHPYYSMSPLAITRKITGNKWTSAELTNDDMSNAYITFGAGNNVWRPGTTEVRDEAGTDTINFSSSTFPYKDTSNPVAKHGNVIGANPDRVVYDFANIGNDATPSAIQRQGEFTSLGGPVQEPGVTSSKLSAKTLSLSGVTSNSEGVQKVTYALAPEAARTESFMTHSVVGGLSYKLEGSYPVILGLGGQVEFAGSTSKPAIGNWMMFGKVGINF